jgi:hypothetical protein
MSTVALQSVPGFVDRLVSFTQALDIRRADTDEDREAIFRLRYQAYLREGAIAPNFGRRFSDRFDETENVWIFGLRLDGALVSSIRVHVATEHYPESPTVDAFSDILMPKLKAGKIIVDPTRLVADLEASRLYPELPYATVRLGFVASEYFKADLGLAAVRPEHQAYYRRVFMLDTLSEPRPYLGLTKKLGLMGVHYPSVRDQIIRRFPHMRSTPAERELLFGGPMARQLISRTTEPAEASSKAARPPLGSAAGGADSRRDFA